MASGQSSTLSGPQAPPLNTAGAGPELDQALADGTDEFFKRTRIYVVSYLLTLSLHPPICPFIHSFHRVKQGDQGRLGGSVG